MGRNKTLPQEHGKKWSFSQPKFTKEVRPAQIKIEREAFYGLSFLNMSLVSGAAPNELSQE